MPFTPSTHADSVAKAIKAKLSPGGCLACKAKKQSCSGPSHCGLCLRRGHACVFKACTLKGDVVDLQATIPRVLRLSKMMDTVHKDDKGTKTKGAKKEGDDKGTKGTKKEGDDKGSKRTKKEANDKDDAGTKETKKKEANDKRRKRTKKEAGDDDEGTKKTETKEADDKKRKRAKKEADDDDDTEEIGAAKVKRAKRNVKP